MQIDQQTLKIAKDNFEVLYGRFEDIGLSNQAIRDLLRYGRIPMWIRKTNGNLAIELKNIYYEYRKHLVKVMKVYRTL